MSKSILFGLLLVCVPVSLVRCEPSAPLPDDAAPQAVLEAMRARWKEVKDYSCTMITMASKGDKTDRTTMHYSYKNPDLWMVKVVEGSDKGTSVAKGPDGRIRANAGGMLSLITITMEPNDPRLQDVRGAPLSAADPGTQVKEFVKRGEVGWTFERRPDETLPDGGAAIVLQVSGPADTDGATRELFIIEKSRLMLRASKTYEGETVVDDTVYKDVKLDAGLAADFFKM